MTKFKAFATHLGISLLVVGCVFSIIFFVWYPEPLFTAMHGWPVLKILVFVDLILGPILTFVVYKPEKPSLKFDLSIIALVQIAALSYGTWVFFKERPLFLVHAIDVFHIVTASDIDPSEVKVEALKDIPLVGPRMAIVFLPESEKSRSELTQKVLLEGAADIERQPSLYQPYEDHVQKVLERGIKLDDLADPNEATQKKIENFKSKHGTKVDSLVFVPLKKKYGFLLLALDKNTGLPVTWLDVE